MDDLSPVNRPVTMGEMAIAFRVRPDRLERLAERHRIRPACRIGGVRCYGTPQIRRLYAALQGVAVA